MKLLIASNNAHKVREIEEILSGYFDEMVTMREAGLDINVVEDGLTFRDNAVKKATEILEKSGFDATLADDTGLCVDALGGAPGVFSARYAGEGHDTDANNALLMENMKEVPDEQRSALAASPAAWLSPGKGGPCWWPRERRRGCSCARLPGRTASATTPTSSTRLSASPSRSSQARRRTASATAGRLWTPCARLWTRRTMPDEDRRLFRHPRGHIGRQTVL